MTEREGILQGVPVSNQCYGQPGLSPSRDSGKIRTHASELSHPWSLSESEIHPEKEVRDGGRLSASDISQIQLHLDLAMPEGSLYPTSQ